jgi:hypothetical protein
MQIMLQLTITADNVHNVILLAAGQVVDLTIAARQTAYHAIQEMLQTTTILVNAQTATVLVLDGQTRPLIIQGFRIVIPAIPKMPLQTITQGNVPTATIQTVVGLIHTLTTVD